MAYKDMREWISKLEAEGELKRIRAKVDWNLEISEIARRAIADRGPALLFENIQDYGQTRSTQYFTNGLARRSRIALMLGVAKDTPREELISLIRKRFKQAVTPLTVPTGPVKEHILKGSDVDLYQFPVPRYHPLDGGRYIDTFCGIVTRDPENGSLNVGLYRGMIIGKNKIAKLLSPHQHWGQHYLKYQQRGQAMPVAIVYGWDPVLPFVASAPLAHPPDEYETMGALRQAPVELVKCETNDLMVPASAEIVVEGTISPDPASYATEGPFGEWTGYYGSARRRPVVEVSCITHRHNPILRGMNEGMKPGVISEAGLATFYSHTALMWNYLEGAGVPGVLDIIPAPTVIVKIRKMYEGQAKQIAAALFGCWLTVEFTKTIMVVDEDVDIHNLRALELAFRDRVDARDSLIVYPGNPGSPLDPSSIWEDELATGISLQNKLLIDATIDWTKHPIRKEFGNKRYPPKCAEMDPSIEALVSRRWQEYGL
jgi:UbiD family decarboxylase